MRRYEDFLRQRDVDSLARVVRSDVEEFAQELSAGTPERAALAPASASRTVVAVRGWHRFALAEGWTTDDPSRLVKPRAVPQRLPKALSTAQVEAILEAASVGDGAAALRDRALLEVVYATGARISEAIGLDVDDLALEAGAEAVVLRGKGNKERVVPIGGYAVEALDAYVVRARSPLAQAGRGTSALFLNARGGRLSRQSAWTILRAAAERAGIPDVSPHTLRHSFATHLLTGGADVRVVQELLGHASVTTTQIYTAVTQDTLREVYTTFHPRALS